MHHQRLLQLGFRKGMYNDSACKDCTMESYCTGANSVTHCPAGRFGNKIKQTCKTCLAGHFCRGKELLEPCTPGKNSKTIEMQYMNLYVRHPMLAMQKQKKTKANMTMVC